MDLIYLQAYAYPAPLSTPDFRTRALPVGRPDGPPVFEPGPGRRLETGWQTFLHEDLYGQSGGMGDMRLHTLVTVDRGPDDIHICFMHDPNALRSVLSPMAHIDRLATAMLGRLQSEDARKHRLEAQANAAGANFSLTDALKKAATGLLPAQPSIAPAQCRFYIHHWPVPDEKERFMRADMTFRNGFYTGHEWHHYDTVPAAIHNAYSGVTLKKDLKFG